MDLGRHALRKVLQNQLLDVSLLVEGEVLALPAELYAEQVLYVALVLHVPPLHKLPGEILIQRVLVVLRIHNREIIDVCPPEATALSWALGPLGVVTSFSSTNTFESAVDWVNPYSMSHG